MSKKNKTEPELNSAQALAQMLIKGSSNKHAHVLGDSDKLKIREYIHTGNYALNALISGDPFKGLPSGRVVQLAGPNSTGKSFFTQEVIRHAQKAKYAVAYFDTEGAQDKDALIERGIDETTLMPFPVSTYEDTKEQIVELVDKIEETKKIEDAPRFMIVIDSIGQLGSRKEFTDVRAKSDKKDMTKQQQNKSLFRVITNDCSMKHIPVIVLNHVYANITSFTGGNVVSGGSGSHYSSSAIIELSKSQAKESQTDKELLGAAILCTSIKNRFAREKRKIRVVIHYQLGLLPYSGLFELCKEHGFDLPKEIKEDPKTGKKKEGSKYFINGKKYWEKELRYAGDEAWEYLLKEGGLTDWMIEYFSYSKKEEDGTISIFDDGYEEELEKALMEESGGDVEEA